MFQLSAAPMINEPIDTSVAMRPAPVTVGVIHGILLTLWISTMTFVIPTFGEMFANFGARLPTFTQFLLDISVPFRRWFFGAVLFFGFLVWADTEIYRHICESRGRLAGLTWFWTWTAFLLVLLLSTILGLFMPVFCMGEVVNR